MQDPESARDAGGVGRDVLDEREWRLVARTLRLSVRERQIVERMFDDASEVAIADDLGISPHTVHTHIERLYRKIGVGSRCAVIVRVFAAFRAACTWSHPRPDRDARH